MIFCALPQCFITFLVLSLSKLVRLFLSRNRRSLWLQIRIYQTRGVGKTAISSKLARKIAGEFKFIFWQSLRNAPSFLELLTKLILFVFQQKAVNVPDSLDARLNVLLSCEWKDPHCAGGSVKSRIHDR